ncbi:hypothetical protein BJ741DRAFT_612344 [Chytriomyces cf. hyalinus JEL632]|nr:hypothetical protein BJ741DRAFT_612344 [Chytriomyces cf. hyalinus JEL632]
MIVPILAAVMATVAVAQAPTANLQTCVAEADYNASYDYFPEKISNRAVSKNLKYTYNNNYKTIVNSFSNETIVLYQCGTPMPTVAGATVVIAVPIQNMTIADTTIVPYVELLGKRSALKYATGGTLAYISSPCVQAEIAANPKSFQEIDSKNITAGIEQIRSTDAYLHYYGSYTANVTNDITFPASADPGVMGRLGWLGVTGSLFNLEGLANTVSNTIYDNYDALSKNANKASFKPVVAWIEYFQAYAGSDTYPATPASWSINAAQYILDYTTAAGATSFVPTSSAFKASGAAMQVTKYTYTTAADLLADLKEVDIVIDLSFYDVNTTDFGKSFGARADFLTESTNEHKFIQKRQIYMFNGETSPANGGSSFFESGTVEINIVLADLISATHPETLPNYNPTYIRNIFNNDPDVVTASQCADFKIAAVAPVVKDFVAPTATALPVVSATAAASPKATASKSAGVVNSAVAGVVAFAALFML